MKIDVISKILFVLFCTIILALTIRGVSGNPHNATLNSPEFKENGPFELSPERGKFALTYSIVEDKSFNFSVPVARFTIPDLGFHAGNYVSLFAPGVSVVTIPGYIIGKYFGVSQIGTFAIISIFALINVLLIRAIALRLGANIWASTLGALIFLFATPAFPYAVTLYQHHISVFLILMSIYALLRWKGLLPLSLVWFLFAASVVVDNPNLLMMLPIAFFALGRFILVEVTKKQINVKLLGLVTFLTALIPVIFFLWFNYSSNGGPFKLSGTLQSVKEIDENGLPLQAHELAKRKDLKFEVQDLQREKTATGFFRTRNLVNGFYTHFISKDRGILYFTPVILMGLLGMTFFYKQNPKILSLFLAIIGVNILLYSMWGDPYGGWAFGSRYLIPSYALMSIFISLALTAYRKNYLILTAFYVLLIYSIYVNTLGALTSNANPPKVEVLNLEKLTGVEQKYTYQRNFDYLKIKGSKSFIFQTYLKDKLSPTLYYLIISTTIISMAGFLIIALTNFSKGGLK